MFGIVNDKLSSKNISINGSAINICGSINKITHHPLKFIS